MVSGDLSKPIGSLAAILAVSLVAIAAVASEATATALCDEAEDPCVEQSTYPVGTKIEGKLATGVAALKSGFVTVECKASSIAGVTTKDLGSGEPLLGEATSLTFSECTGCTKVEAIGLPYTAEFMASKEKVGDGTLTLSKGKEGNPGVLVSGCPFGVSCTYGAAEVVLETKGGAPASVVAEAEPVSKQGGSPLCSSTGTYTATYSVAAPEALFAAQGVAATTLCTGIPAGSPLTCPANTAYRGVVKGVRGGNPATTFTKPGGPVITCTTSTYSGPFQANGLSGQNGGITGVTLESGGGVCTSTIEPPNNWNATLSMNTPFDTSKFTYLGTIAPHGAFVLAKAGGVTPVLRVVFNGNTCDYNAVFLGGSVTNGTAMIATALVLEYNWEIQAGKPAACPSPLLQRSALDLTDNGGNKLFIAER
jgi:hypothetical protein